MKKALCYIAIVLFQYTAAEWVMTLSLVFGGCCSNAWALELTTAQNSHAGTLITFAQFLLVSLHGLYKHLLVLGMREAVCRRVVDDVLGVRARRKHVDPVYIAIEGPPLEGTHFAESLTHDLRSAAPGVGVALLSGMSARKILDMRDGRNLPPHAYLLKSEIPGDAVVIVSGDGLSTPELQIRWDYTILLLGSDHVDLPTERPSSLLIIDVRSVTEPVIVYPTGHFVPKPVFRALSRIRLAHRAIPISRWAVQVALFLLTSLMNNAAFAYDVPMTVHIIFRSGGLVINMFIGYFIGGRRYSAVQVVSVVLVTLGVACTTLSAVHPTGAIQAAAPGSYFIGILLLTFALVLSGLMGLAQDRAYERYGRGHWREGMFYLHFLALPGFAFVWRDLVKQVRVVNASSRIQALPGVWIPSFYSSLLLNVTTQLVCISGVHRLTSRVNSLTVTLVLVLRKAVSLGISVLLNENGGDGGLWLWGGASLVLAGTVGYAVGDRSRGQTIGKGMKGD